ncbi:hypothetical protein D3C76_1443410 [compost metagenome]
MHRDRIQIAVLVITPNLAENLLARQNLVRVERQETKDFKFLGGTRYRTVSDLDLITLQMDLQFGKTKNILRFLCRSRKLIHSS